MALCFLATPTAAQEADLLFVVDASGSMWGQVDGENKIVIARDVFANLADRLDEDRQAGLIAYGHRREGDCGDIETLVPMAPLDRERLKATVRELNPKGKTPLAASTQQAVETVRARAAGSSGSETTVVLLTDGLETCDADPCSVVREAKSDGLPFLLHVIGFDVAQEEVSQLECMAQAGGGLFLAADDSAALSEALDAAVQASAETYDAALEVKATRNGELQDVAIAISPIEAGVDDERQAVTSRSYTDPSTNPRRVPLLAGRYAVQVKAVGIKGDVTRRFEVNLAAGETAQHAFDFSTGKLRVGVTDNGELLDASVRVRVAGTSQEVASGRTYTSARSNPKEFTLTAGTYDVWIKPLGIDGADDAVRENLVVGPAEPTEVSHAVLSGSASIKAIDAIGTGALVDALVFIVDESGREVARSRTYTTERRNPARFRLVPGRYTVKVRQPRSQELVELGLEITSGKDEERVVEVP